MSQIFLSGLMLLFPSANYLPLLLRLLTTGFIWEPDRCNPFLATNSFLLLLVRHLLLEAMHLFLVAYCKLQDCCVKSDEVGWPSVAAQHCAG